MSVFSSVAPPAGQDGASIEGTAAGEAETRASEGRRQQYGIWRPSKTLSTSQLHQSYTQSKGCTCTCHHINVWALQFYVTTNLFVVFHMRTKVNVQSQAVKLLFIPQVQNE